MPLRVCWYRLDPEDKNLSVFIAHLAEAIFPSDATEFAKSRKALKASVDTKFQAHSAISTICREMWTHHSHVDNTRTYIVLDDFQNVAQVPDICNLTSYMLDNLPPPVLLFY